MKKLKQKIFLLFAFVVANTFAQQAIVSAGGNAIGSGGSSSYSIGQILNAYQTGSNGSVAQGVQQPFEISTLSGQQFNNITLEAIVYPNPVKSNLTLFIKNLDFKNLNYELYDVQGRFISNEIISSEQTLINLESKALGNYILNINANATTIKSFKIIKN